MAEREVIPPRIVKITYRSGINGKCAVAYAKVPYGGLFDLNEKLSRLFSKRQVRWFRVDEAKPEEIARVRDSLVRWPEALAATASRTKIDLLT
jgi:hypothetical protein